MTSTPEDPDQRFGANQPPYPGAQPDPAYGSYPTGPGSAPQQRQPVPEQPPSIALAVKLMLVGAALSVLSLIYSLTTLGGLKDDIAEQLREDDVNVSQSTIDAAYGVAITFAFLFGLVGALLWVWMAWKNGQGRGWARIVATVFGGLNALGLLFSLGGGNAEPIALVSSAVSVAVAALILVLLWRKESSEFYDASAASRLPY